MRYIHFDDRHRIFYHGELGDELGDLPGYLDDPPGEVILLDKSPHPDDGLYADGFARLHFPVGFLLDFAAEVMRGRLATAVEEMDRDALLGLLRVARGEDGGRDNHDDPDITGRPNTGGDQP